MESLWPDDVDIGCKSSSAITILREQAIMLGNATNNILKGEVRGKKESPSGKMIFDFYILAPLLQNYRYKLLQLQIDMVNLYPVELYVNEEISRELGFEVEENRGKSPILIYDENQLKAELQRIFATRITRNVLRNLIDSSREPSID